MPTNITRLPDPEVCARIAVAAAGLGGNRHIGRAIMRRGAVDLVAAVYDQDPCLDLDPALAAKLRTLGSGRVVAQILETTSRLGMTVLTPEHELWPRQVDALGSGAPIALWASGAVEILLEPPIVVTGETDPDPWLRHDVVELTTRIADDGWTVATAARPGVDHYAHRSVTAMNGDLITVAGTARQAQHASEVVISENPPNVPVVIASALRTPVVLAALGGKVLVAGGQPGSGAMRTGVAAHALARPLGVVGDDPERAGGNRLHDAFGAPRVGSLREVERLV